MCGILAYHKSTGLKKSDLHLALSCLNQIKHRGPDGEGVVLIDSNTGNYQMLKTEDTPKDINTNLLAENYVENSANLFFAQRRLSIIDLSSNGFQPMKDENGNWIIFNGEIYNYLEIRTELESKGYRFKTNSDTEVILKAYTTYGIDCLHKFNGMWAIIIWDNQSKKIVISNDRYGVKPLYYYENRTEWLFASEIKAYYPLKEAVKKLNHMSINLFLDAAVLDSGTNTFFEDISRFPNAHYQIIDFNSRTNTTLKYWNHQSVTDYSYTEDRAVEEFNAILKDAINIRLRADVECGVALSGGLDSSVVCYYAHQLLKEKNVAQKLKSFSVIFPNQEGDESYFSKYIAQDLNLDAKFVNPFEEFSFGDLEMLTYHLDYPLQTTSYYASWSLMRLVSGNKIKVLLEGQGADELFAGYNHHFYKYGRELILKGKIPLYLAEVKAFSKFKNLSVGVVHKTVINEVKLFAKLKLGISKINFKKEYINLLDCLDDDFSRDMLPSFLRLDDRSSMAFGVESRLPFMDYRLVDFSGRLPSHLKIKEGWQKHIIRKSADIVPNEIRYRKDKKGFTTPQNEWMQKYRKEFLEYIPFLRKVGVEFVDIDYKNPHEMNKLFRQYSLAMWAKNL